MKRKKALALFMAAAVFSTMLTGCGNDGGGQSQSDTKQSSQTEQSTGGEQSGESQGSQSGGG